MLLTVLGLATAGCGSSAATTPASVVSAAPSVSTVPAATAVQNSTVPGAGAHSGVVTNVPFTKTVSCGSAPCQVMLDVFIPAGPGPFRTVVLLRGGPSGMGGRSYVAPFAQQLADVGLLVFNADYRDVFASGGGFPAAFGDISCAVQFARTEAPRYGGDGGPVTLVGHSLGAWVGSVDALDPTPIKGDCLDDNSGRPDSFVGLAGDYRLDAPGNQNDLLVFFGGPPATTADLRAKSDPFRYATGSKVPVTLIAGTADTTVDPTASTSLGEFLKQKGWDVKLTLMPTATHASLIDATEDGPKSVEQILEATQAARLH